MTEYVILRGSNDSGTVFAVDGEETGSSAETAIRKYAARNPPTKDAEGNLTVGFFAAVPKRSWVVASVTNEVTTQIKVTTV